MTYLLRKSTIALLLLLGYSDAAVAADSQDRAIAVCINLFDTFAVPLQALLPKAQVPIARDQAQPYVAVAMLTRDLCRTVDGRRNVLAHVKRMNSHTGGPIGILLAGPISARDDSLRILEGLHASDPSIVSSTPAAALPPPSGTRFLVREVTSVTSMEKAVAQLVFVDRVSAIMSNVGTDLAAILNQWADAINLPVIILGPQPQSAPLPRWSVYRFPDPSRLSQCLATTMADRKQTKIAILASQSATNNPVTRSLRQSAIGKGMPIVHDLTFAEDNYESLDAAVKTLLEIDPIKRAAELTLLTDQAKASAEAAGEKFDLKSVALPPRVGFDALFFPNDYRSLKFLLRALRFYQAPRLSLYGTQAWRSAEFVTPFDPTLRGNQFADFIGDYNDLPAAIRPKKIQDRYFIDAAEAVSLDFKWLGYQGGEFIKGALSGPPAIDRQAMLGRLQTFNAKATLPSYVFQVVAEHQINMHVCK